MDASHQAKLPEYSAPFRLRYHACTLFCEPSRSPSPTRDSMAAIMSSRPLMRGHLRTRPRPPGCGRSCRLRPARPTPRGACRPRSPPARPPAELVALVPHRPPVAGRTDQPSLLGLVHLTAVGYRAQVCAHASRLQVDAGDDLQGPAFSQVRLQVCHSLTSPV